MMERLIWRKEIPNQKYRWWNSEPQSILKIGYLRLNAEGYVCVEWKEDESPVKNHHSLKKQKRPKA
jgi:hypothetical protein